MKLIHIPTIKNSKIHTTSKVHSASHLVHTVMNRYSYIGSNCTIINTEIGNFCSIADNTIIGGSSHPIEWVSTSPVFIDGKNILRKNFSKHTYRETEKTIIGNDVWVGSNCLIKSGVTISSGAIIGMGSVVTKDVGPYEIWAGNPARIIRKRFSGETIENLLSICWWDFDDNKLKNYSHDMDKTSEFIKHFIEKR